MIHRTANIGSLLATVVALISCGGTPSADPDLPSDRDLSGNPSESDDADPESGGSDAEGSATSGPASASEVPLSGPTTEDFKVSDWGPLDPCAPMPAQCKGAPDPVLFAQCEVMVGNASFRGDGDGACRESFAVGAIRAAMCDAKVKPTADDYKRAKCTVTTDPCKHSERQACKSSSGPPLKCTLKTQADTMTKSGSNCGHMAPEANTSIMKALCEKNQGITAAQFNGITCTPDEGQVK